MAYFEAVLAHFGTLEGVSSVPFAIEREAEIYLSKVRATIDARAILLARPSRALPFSVVFMG